MAVARLITSAYFHRRAIRFRSLRDRVVDTALRIMMPVDRLVRRSRPWHRVRRALDPRLPAMTPVIGVDVGGERRAYPVDALPARGVVNDELGGTAVALITDPDSGLAAAYHRKIDGQILTLIPCPISADGAAATDAETGSRWDVAGRAVAGPLQGKRLAPLPHFNGAFWFSWALFRPGTSIFGR